MASEIKLPNLGDNVASGDVIDVKVKVGDDVQSGQGPDRSGGRKDHRRGADIGCGQGLATARQKGDKVKPGQVIALIEGSNGQAPAAAPAKSAAPPKEAALPPPKPAEPVKAVAPPAPPPKAAPVDNDRVVHAGPATRRFAREFEVDLAQVPGSGPAGRVSQDDVKDYLRALANGGGGSGGVKIPPMPNFEQWGAVTTKPFESIRKATRTI